MGYTPYQIRLMIPAQNPITWVELQQRLVDKFNWLLSKPGSTHEIIQNQSQMQIHHDDWVLRVYWHGDDHPDVAFVSREIAQLTIVKERSDRDVIASCNRWVTTGGDPDPNMDYFNDYVYVLEVLETVPDAYLFDNYAGKLRRTDEPDS